MNTELVRSLNKKRKRKKEIKVDGSHLLRRLFLIYLISSEELDNEDTMNIYYNYSRLVYFENLIPMKVRRCTAFFR